MWPFAKPYKFRSRARRDDRFYPKSLKSNLGDVVDLSGVGARVVCLGKPKLAVGNTGWLILKAQRRRMMLQSRVVRLTKVSFRKYEIGLEFLDVDADLRNELRKLAFQPDVQSIISASADAA